MCRFIETMRVEKGEIVNLDFHRQRFEATHRHYWPGAEELSWQNVYAAVDARLEKAKLRFLYDETSITEISCTEYVQKDIRSLKLVRANDISYPFKHSDRSALEKLKAQQADCDEILIVKDNHITDTSFTNVAFFDGKEWFTSDTPLLSGTRRASLIAQGRLKEREILTDDLPAYTSIALFNAMIDLGELVLPLHEGCFTIR